MVNWKKVGLWSGGILVALFILGALVPPPDEAAAPDAGPTAMAAETPSPEPAPIPPAAATPSPPPKSGPLVLLEHDEAPLTVVVRLTNPRHETTYVTYTGFRLVDANGTATEPDYQSTFPSLTRIGAGENAQGRLYFLPEDAKAWPFTLKYDYIDIQAEVVVPRE